MPYRLNPSNRKEVQVYKDGKWKRLKLHPSVAKALKHLAALKINVKEE